MKTPGTRVRFNEQSVWPERVGCEGVIVDPDVFEGRYPGGKQLGSHVIVLLDADPLDRHKADHKQGFTCVTDKASVDEIDRLVDSTSEGA